MKKVIAYIKPHKVSDVTLALQDIEGLTGMTTSDARGFGRGQAKEALHTIRHDAVAFIPNVRIEIVCLDALVDEIVEAIRREAHTGLRGDGKIYVSPIERSMRISTSELGDAAV